MNSTEVLFCALLLTKDAESAPNGRSDLEKWSSAVLAEEKHALELEAAWKPRTDKRTAIDYFGPLERVFKRSWPYAELDTVGLAMQAWRRDGQYDGLTGELLHNYLLRTPLACRTCKKTAPPKRWRSWAVVKIGRLLYESAPALRKLLKLDVASEEAKPLHVVAAERAERISSLEAELEQARQKEEALRKHKEKKEKEEKPPPPPPDDHDFIRYDFTYEFDVSTVRPGAAGWPMRREREGRGAKGAFESASGLPAHTTVWLALTEMSPKTSCMYDECLCALSVFECLCVPLRVSQCLSVYLSPSQCLSECLMTMHSP